MIRAVLDATVHASALIQAKGPSAEIFRHLVADRTFHLITSKGILDEVLRCLFYPRVCKRIAITDDAIQQWVAAIGILADVVSEQLSVDVVKADPDDNKYLAAAFAGRAQYVVTGDRHLLDL